jgi:thiol-disulfide isomerase/thioredoxin
MIEVVVTILAFAVIALLVYQIWSPMLVKRPKREVSPNEARLYFFYTEWCGHSQRAMPQWKALEEKIGTDGYFGKTHVTLVPIDADKDRKTAELYEVRGYPTVMLETSTGVYEYKKRPTTDGLLEFLRKSLGPEPSGL